MKFIENDDPYTRKLIVRLNHPSEDSLSDYFDLGFFRDAIVKADPVSNRLTNGFSQKICHALCDGAGCKLRGSRTMIF